MFHNLTVTALSVAVALIIGSVELLGLLAQKLGVRAGPLAWAAQVDLEHMGYGIVVLFVATCPGDLATRALRTALVNGLAVTASAFIAGTGSPGRAEGDS